jgi:hypothetical protein
LATRFYTYVFSKYLCFFHLHVFALLFSGLCSLFVSERIDLRKLFAKLDCCRTLCSFLRGQVVNYSQHSLTMLLSKLTPDAAKALTRPEEVFSIGLHSTTMVDHFTSTWFCTLSALQVKPRCLLGGSAPWVPPSPSAVGRCALVWSYCLVRASADVNCYLSH